MKHSKYYIWLLSGLFCFLLFLKLLEIPGWISILLDIVSIFAGGIFASTVVAIFVEIINNKYYHMQIQKQKKILLNEIIILLQRLIKNELRSIDLSLFFCDTKDAKSKKVNISLNDSINSILKELVKIREKKLNFEDNTIINDNYFYRKEHFEISFYNSSLEYYKKIDKQFRKIIDNKVYYLVNDILSDKDIEMLMSAFIIVEDIVRYSESKSLELVFDFKEIFFKDLNNFIKYFELHEYYRTFFYDSSLYYVE